MRGRTRTLQSKKYTQKKRKRFLAAGGIWAGCIIAVFTAIVCFLRYDSLLIHEVQVTGNRAVSADDVRSIVEAHLDQSLIGLLPNRSFFLYPAAEIVREIAEKIPRVETAHLVRHGDILSAEISERIPSAVLCHPAVKNSPAEACFMTDDTAFIYADAPALSGKIYIVMDIPDTAPAMTGEIAVGKTFMDMKQFRALMDLADGVTKLGLPIVRMTLKSDGDIELLAESNTEVFVRSAANYDQVLTNLMLFLEKAKQQPAKTPAKKSAAASSSADASMSRIDLRYGNSVFYK